jgi:hypothetical protein
MLKQAASRKNVNKFSFVSVCLTSFAKEMTDTFEQFNSAYHVMNRGSTGHTQ